MTLLTRIAERVINRPLLVHPDKLPIVLSVLEGRIPVGDVSGLRRAADEHIDAMPDAGAGDHARAVARRIALRRRRQRMTIRRPARSAYCRIAGRPTASR
jgi:hypothetical protein